MPTTTERRTELLLGEFALVRFACSCGWESSAWPADLAYEAEAEIRCHLADEHGAEFGFGRCQVCNQPTDHFRAHSELEALDLFLCELHAPKVPVVVDQADAGDELDQGDELAGGS